MAKRLGDQGVEVVLTREPGGTPFAELIREVVLNPEAPSHSALAEALLFYAARADHLEHVIRPALARGQWVLCDRFSDSTRVYQSLAGGLDTESFHALENVVVGKDRPDLTLIMDIDATLGLRRADRRREVIRDPSQIAQTLGRPRQVRGPRSRLPREAEGRVPQDRRRGAASLRRHRRRRSGRGGAGPCVGCRPLPPARGSSLTMARAPAVQEIEDLPEIDRLDGFPHPRATQRLYGHEAAERTLAEAFESDRLHHGWLIAGAEGIGKATLAYRFARFLPGDTGGAP